MKKILALVIILIMVTSIFMLTGCDQRQADDVSYNISLQADNFNVLRRLTVINVLNGDVIFQMEGNFSIDKESDGDLAIIGENDDGTFYKHFVNLQAGGSTGSYITYVVQDLDTNHVSKDHYTINFNPKMWLPEVKTVD